MLTFSEAIRHAVTARETATKEDLNRLQSSTVAFGPFCDEAIENDAFKGWVRGMVQMQLASILDELDPVQTSTDIIFSAFMTGLIVGYKMADSSTMPEL